MKHHNNTDLVSKACHISFVIQKSRFDMTSAFMCRLLKEITGRKKAKHPVQRQICDINN